MSLGALAVKLKKAFKFVDQSYLTANAATSSFSTIAVSGQSNVVADSTTDTLTLVAGAGMTITTNATNDSITFAASASGGITNGTQLTVNGQSSRSFTVPTTTKRIVFMLNGVSGANGGTAPIQFQLGDAGGLETSGYLGAVAQSNSTSANLSFAAQTGFCIDTTAGAGGQVYYGHVVFVRMDDSSNTWSVSGNISNPAFVMSLAGIKALSQPITTVAIVAPGTTFDLSGTVNIAYE
jgi:hypothetical protein